MAENLASGNSINFQFDADDYISIAGNAQVIASGPTASVNTTTTGTATFGPYPGGAAVRIIATGALTYTRTQPTRLGASLEVDTNATTGAQSINAASLQVLANSGVGSGILPLTPPARTGQVCFENITVAADSTTTLFQLSGQGPGVMVGLQMIFGTVAGGKDGRIRIYVDGEVTPSIDMQMHHLGTLWTPTGGGATRFRHRYIQSGFNNDAAGRIFTQFNYPIPFDSSIRVDYIAPSTGLNLYVQGKYHLLRSPLPYRLKFTGPTYQNRLLAVTPTQLDTRQVKFLDLPSGAGNRGWIVGFMWGSDNSQGGSAPMLYLENNIVVYQGTQARDGTVVPIYNSTGGEDFFESAYYYNNGEGSFGNMFVSSRARRSSSPVRAPDEANNITAVIDFLDQGRAIYFDDGCLFTAERGLAALPGINGNTIDLMYGVWYYVPTP